jgi:hypothetical protein
MHDQAVALDDMALAELFQPIAAPSEILRRGRTERAVLDKAQPHLFGQRVRSRRAGDQQAVTGQCLGVGIVPRCHFLHQVPYLALLDR